MSIVLKNVSTYFYSEQILKNVSLEIKENIILSVLGPNTEDKNSFLKLFNRLDETQRGYRLSGEILLHDVNIKNINAQVLRRKVGIVFSKPIVLPGTVRDNLAFGLNIQNINNENILTQKITEVLKFHKLWTYFEDDLNTEARILGSFKTQLLALARVLILNPEIILFQQPTIFLSEISARRFETIITELKKSYTIIISTSNIQKARRISDYTAFIYNGQLIEFNTTQTIFTYPKKELTENYIRGKFE